MKTKICKFGAMGVLMAQIALFVLCSCGTSSLSQSSSGAVIPIEQSNVSVIADKIWTFSQSHPNGFTLDVRTMAELKEGIVVAYADTQNSHSRDQLDNVVRHALKHDGYVGGWYNTEDSLYYFDSSRIFPEKSFGRTRLESAEVQYLWQQWRLKNENKLWLGLRRIDSLLRQLPGELYGDIGKLDVILSCLYYLNTPRKAFQSIMALLMLRDLTCRELGIAMHPMTEDEYESDGRITNPMEMPTTIGRVVAFAETQCDKAQKQTIQLLAQWLRDDYEQSHPKEIEALAETDPLVVINGDVKGDVIERGGTKNENNTDKEE